MAAIAATILAAAIPDDVVSAHSIRTGLLAIGLLTVLGAAVDVLGSRRASRAAGPDEDGDGGPIDPAARRLISESLERQREICDELTRRLEAYDVAFPNLGDSRERLFADLRRQVSQLRCENHRLSDLDRERDDLVAIASHELKTPLTAMSSHIEIMRHYGSELEAEQREESLAALSHETARMTHLVDELLELARVRSGRSRFTPCSFDLRDIVKSVHRTLSPLASERSLRLDVDTPSSPLIAFADPGRIEQIVTNLVANAIKFTPENGAIALEASDDGESVRLTVTDDGPGVDPEERDLVFEAFYRGRHHGEVEGAGIGLHLSREIARRMAGDLTIEDAPRGARFALRLPRRQQENL